jgi:hypothetical protein
VPRWHLTHQHVDLKEMFQARIRAEGTTPAPFRGTTATLHDLQQAHRRLQAHCTELEERIKLYANVIQLLATERGLWIYRCFRPDTLSVARRERCRDDDTG